MIKVTVVSCEEQVWKDGSKHYKTLAVLPNGGLVYIGGVRNPLKAQTVVEVEVLSTGDRSAYNKASFVPYLNLKEGF